MRPLRIFIFFALLAAVLAAGDIFVPTLFLHLAKTPATQGDAVVPPEVTEATQISDTSIFSAADTIPEAVFCSAPALTDLLPSDTARGKLRIMVFGDSQLEGDRFTSGMRSHLRNIYGGSGPGLLQPLMPVMYTRSVDVRASQGWERYTYLSYKSGKIKHKDIGPFMSFCRFLAHDSLSVKQVSATVRVKPSVYADESTKRYDNLRVFYGNLSGECTITVTSSGSYITSDTLLQGIGPYEFSCPTRSVSDLEIEFRGFASPDIYGFSIEGDTGIIIDNIPHRGSAGLEFTMAGEKNLSDLLKKIDPQLIVLQYGLNVVRNYSSDYSYYQRGLERQISLLKEAAPESEILVLSLTDMAADNSGILSSLPNIVAIRDAQKGAADSQSVTFWDSFNAMGGSNSILSWADLDPPLAQSDYTHLTYDGSDSLAMLLLADMLQRPEIIDTANVIKVSDSLEISEIMPVADTVPGDSLRTSPDFEITEYQAAMSDIRKIFHSIIIYDASTPFLFTNIAFWIFLLVLMAGYSIVWNRGFVRNFYLFVFSLFFYYKSGGFFLALLIVSTLTDFFASHLIYKSRSQFFRKLWLIVSLFVNLGMLAYFKYYGFIIESINNLAGTAIPVVDVLSVLSNDLVGTSFDISSIILPVGISFFTFQTISYTVDVYRGKMEPVRNVIDFGFYVSFFPQLVAGPIVRASEFIPQLYAKYSLSKREFGHAIYLIIKGLIKKMIISDFISTGFVDRVFDAPEMYTGAENLLSVYGYGLQIYCDFSGYTDIAIGIALLLGFRLPFNFNSPYKATGVADFWRRWHISLSRWLKDYLYIPLGGNRKGSFRTGVNLIITMAIGGLWHGASARFIFWGLLHGTGLVVNKIWSRIFPAPLRKMKLTTLIQIFLTFNFVSFTWIFFRAGSNADAILIVRKIFTELDFFHFRLIWESYTSVIVLIFIGYFIHFLPGNVKESVRGLFVQAPLVLQFATAAIIALLLMAIESSITVQPFIYFRF